MPTDRETAKVYFTKLEIERVTEAAREGGESVSGFIRRTVLNNLSPVPDTGVAKEAPKILRQLEEFRKPVPTEPGVPYHGDTALPDFVADEPRPAEESGGSGTNQNVRRYEELPANQRGAHVRGRQVGRNDRPSSRTSKRGGKPGTRPGGENHSRCTNAVAPGLYCPKCDRRH